MFTIERALAKNLALGLAGLLGLVIWIGSYYAVYKWGEASCRAEVAELAAEEETARADAAAEEATKNSEEAAKAERKAAEVFTNIDKAVGGLREQIYAREPVTGCDLTTDELQELQRIVEETR